MHNLMQLMFNTISALYIHIGTDGEKIPNYVGYVEVVRRKMTGREEEKGRSTPLASTHVY